MPTRHAHRCLCVAAACATEACAAPLHSRSTIHQHPTALPFHPPAVDKALIQSLDRLGMTVVCERGKDALKCRLPFPRPAADRKDIKTLIVEMTQASAGAFA